MLQVVPPAGPGDVGQHRAVPEDTGVLVAEVLVGLRRLANVPDLPRYLCRALEATSDALDYYARSTLRRV